MQGMCIMLCTIQAGKVLRVAVTEGVKGATADFVRFHCPLVAPEGAIPLLLEKSTPIDGFLICMKAK